MTPRTTSRPRPIPFGALNAPEPKTAPAPLPARFSDTAQRRAPAPIPWGMTVGTAAIAAPPSVVTAEDPRALYEVARRWQGQSVADTLPATPPAPAHRVAAAQPAPLTGDSHARYTGQGSLCVRSSVTGRHYRFARHGDTLRIDKHDLSLLRRIADIELA